MKRATLRIVDVEPDNLLRSEWAIIPGNWRMRNGHTAEVRKILPLVGPHGKPFPVWSGICIECDEPRTWFMNGFYGAGGDHGYDLVRPA